jgi:AcrR family transcriptional regulator
VRSADATFARLGYGATTVRAIAERSDVTTGAIYRHFRNKADLLAAAIARRIETDLEAPSRGRGEGLVDTLARQAREYRDRAGLRALLVEGAHAAHVDADAARTIREVLASRLAQWQAIYEDVAEREQGFAGIDMPTLVIALLAMELGLGVLEATRVDLPDPEAWSALVRRLLEGIA